VDARINQKDVNRAFKNMDRLFRAINQQAYLATRLAAEEYNATVRSGIGVQSTPSFVKKAWKPLSAKWKKMKVAHKEEFWIETGEIYKNIKIHIINKTWKFISIFAGIFKSDDPEAFERAEKNEFGLGRFQPEGGRPLFRPAMDVFSFRIGSGIRRLKKTSATYIGFKKAVTNAIHKVY
jgi:hypothetical protein